MTIQTAGPWTRSEVDTAQAVSRTLETMLREAVDRFGSVDAARDALTVLMHEAVTRMSASLAQWLLDNGHADSLLDAARKVTEPAAAVRWERIRATVEEETR